MSTRSFKHDLTWGTTRGLFGGVVYCAFASVVLLFKGWPSELPTASIYAAYLLGGLSGGVILGALRPYANSPRGAVWVGTLVAIPVVIAFVLLIRGPLPTWGKHEVALTIMCSVILGAMGGRMIWNSVHEAPFGGEPDDLGPQKPTKRTQRKKKGVS